MSLKGGLKMIKLTADKAELTKYLLNRNWLTSGEEIQGLEKPGEGNMNFTLRITTDKRSFIVKQSREYVEKYPQVAAPVHRILREAEFYELIAVVPDLARVMPGIIGLDKKNSVMLLEDLGKGSDFTFLYRKGESIRESELMLIMEFAAKLHRGITVETAPKTISNRAMRALNHEHIFIYPFLKDNGLDLDKVLPGLESASLTFKEDVFLKQSAAELGMLYLADGRSLLHGDYFPGSWLRTAKGIQIIDPEFCFFGPPEFEVGVTIAHLKMADQPENLISKALDYYESFSTVNDTLRQKFTAIEILRRILGLAQLPLQIGLQKRVELMEEAREILLK